MSWQPTERELDLAKRLEALETQASRPVVSGGGLLATIVNGIIARVPTWLITTSLLVFLAWEGWDYFNSWQQLSAETEKLEAQKAKLAADADAKGLNIEGETLRTQSMRAEIAQLRAEIARTKAEADKSQAEADAQNQEIGKVKLAVLQKQAEVQEAEAAAQAKIQNIKFTMRQMKMVNANPLYRMMEPFAEFFYGGELWPTEK